MATVKVRTAKQGIPVKMDDRSGVQRAREWIEGNANLLGGIVAVIFVVFLIVFGIQNYLSRQETRAEERYAQLMRQWPEDFGAADDQTLGKLVPDLEKFIQEHDGRKAASLARLDLARVLYQLRRHEEALAQNRSVLDGARDRSLRSLARYQTAVTLQALGRADEAIAQWTAMKSEPSLVSEREVHWKLALLYKDKKDSPKAVEHLEAALKAAGDYPTNQLIEDQLAVLKTTPSPGS